MPVSIDTRRYDAVLFDLDGVVTDTAAVHAKTWRALFDDVLPRRSQRTDEDHSPFTDADYRHYVDGKPRTDGIRDFLAARGINLPEGRTDDDGDATVCGLATRKQRLF
ncbi:MAG TPA: HAD family hydrolase, partial [Mycobacterium sp.]